MKFKALYILSTAIISAFSASAGETADSTLIITSPERIVIVESATGVKIEVSDANVTDTTIVQTYTFDNVTVRRTTGFQGLSLLNRKNCFTGWDVISDGLGFGFCSAMDVPSGAASEQGKSFELTWTNMLAVAYKSGSSFDISLGVGIDWRNFRITDGTRFVVNDGNVGLSQFDPTQTPGFSRIKIFSLQFPLLWRQTLPINNLGGRFKIHFGPVFCINTHGSVLSRWTNAEGVPCKESIKAINLRTFTVDLCAWVALAGNVGIYFRYSPMKMLTSSKAFNFTPVSTGITCGF